ncbi:MAG: LysE family transporter [Acidovorax sp.]|nr:LysE family transporter [Acidovorax sp.]
MAPDLWLYFLAVLAVILLPGMDMAYVMASSLSGGRRGAVYWRAVTTCLLNPKAYAFMLALFPAFLHSNGRSLVMQVLALGMITAATQIVVYGTVAALAVRARDLIRARQSLIARTMGGLLIVSALLTATRAWAG